jgi:phage-related protein
MDEKPLVWMHGEVKTPPFSSAARIEVGHHVRMLQQGETLELPHSRPMPSIGPSTHELRIQDEDVQWRIAYFIHEEAIVILGVWKKTTQKTPQRVIENCRRRREQYLAALEEDK